MSDKKLVELIEAYGNSVVALNNAIYRSEGVSWKMTEANKSKQAIVDYVEGEKQDAEKWQLDIAYKHGIMDATKAIRQVYEAHKHNDVVFNNVCSPLWQAIKADGLKAGWIKEKK